VLPFLLTDELFHAGCLQLSSPVKSTVSCKDKMASKSLGMIAVIGGSYAATEVS
jgi:hypothetical protein